MRHNDITNRSGLVLVRDIVGIEQDDRTLRRDHAVGARERIRRGAYVDDALWASMTPADRYRARILAAVRTRRRMPVVAFDSAAALWGYPRASAWPGVVHLIVNPESAARSKNGVTIHREGLEAGDVVEMEGILVTSPQRTLVDLARAAQFRDSVAAIDCALNPERSTNYNQVTKDQLLEAHERVVSPRGGRQSLKAIKFGNGLADNAGESESRVVIFELGFPDPVLQRQHVNPNGGHYFTDTEWPEYRTIGELDGRGKYLKEEYLSSMSPGEAVYAEKIREDHLRAEGNVFARWGIPDIREPWRLQRILSKAGLPLVR
ncbi:hypothetical protein [Cryobacterium shii]|uniref:AbiEi antitoxin C-terminal domain-containing protein n=1 Tax=Cryobacterium shii TaxID=1259235 RepID=A0AAQ2HEX7_9MICO|nr:hypothetical protein [Cryobacterium shii]TFC43410.1 hypothetical protein E3O49_13190 [Cryobacterium shii]